MADKQARLTVQQVLNESRRSSTAHKKCCKLLWQLVHQDPDGSLKTVKQCLGHALAFPEKDVQVERVLKLFFALAANPVAEHKEDCDGALEDLMFFLLETSNAQDKDVRLRSCQTLSGMLHHMGRDAELTEEFSDQLVEQMLARTRDKIPQIRAQAVRVLARLQDAGEAADFEECEIVGAFSELLAGDRNKEVRKAVQMSIAVCPRTLEAVLSRTRDVSDEVRKLTYDVLAQKMDFDTLSAEEKASLLVTGLQDRCPDVASAACKLLHTWFERDCEEDVVALLKAISASTQPEAAELAITSLFAGNVMEPLAVAKHGLASKQCPRFCSETHYTTPEMALFWRIVCEHLHRGANAKGLAAANASGAAAAIEAAAAGDYLQVLEDLLPETVESMMDIVQHHASAGRGHIFATTQLLLMTARCMDLTDASGRMAGSSLLTSLISQCGWGFNSEVEAEQWTLAVRELSRKVLVSHEELAGVLLNAVQQLHLAGCTAGVAEGNENQQHSLLVLEVLLLELKSGRGLNGQVWSLQDALDQCIIPALRSDDITIRMKAMKCLGLHAMLDSGHNLDQTQLALLVTAVQHESSHVRVKAIQALCDLALMRSPKALDAMQAPAQAANQGRTTTAPLQGKPIASLLLDSLVHSTNALSRASSKQDGRLAAIAQGDMAVASATAEGLVKLLLHNNLYVGPASQLSFETAEVVKALSQLLVLNFDPATEEATAMRQCLAVFFEVYSAHSSMHKQLLVKSLLPAGRSALLLGGAGKKTVAPRVLQYVLHLIQAPLREDADCEPVLDYGTLAETVMMEVLVCRVDTTSKPYLLALCKVAAALIGQADESSKSGMARCWLLGKQIQHAAKDRMLQKEIGSVMEKLQCLDTTEPQPFGEEDMARLHEVVAGHAANMDLADYPLPFAGGDTVTSSTSASGSRARSSRRSAVSAKDSSRDSDDDAQGPSVPPQTAAKRQLPARAARSAQKPVVYKDASSESSSDTTEESEEDTQYSEAMDEKSLNEDNHNKLEGSRHSVVTHDEAEELDSDSDFENPPPKAVAKVIKGSSRFHRRGVLVDNVAV